MKRIQRLGILTGGGDCPGINAVIRAVVKPALLDHGVEVVGIEDGFLGLLEERLHPLGDADVSGILTRGGTILGSTNRCDPRKWSWNGSEPRDETPRCLETLQRHRIDALVVIGGDGTMSIAHHLSRRGAPVVGVPKTIDNDLHGTDLTFGFLTAVSTAAEALDRVHTTAQSHHRAMVVEVMGRNAGWLALHAGVASGSDVILMPEIPFDVEAVAVHCARRRERRKGFTIVCVSEGAAPKGGKRVVARLVKDANEPERLGGIANVLAGEIEERTGVESRAVTLGHVQRGGSPIAPDRVLATELGHAAVTLLLRGMTNRMVAWQRGRVVDVPLEEGARGQRLVPAEHQLVQAARGIGTIFGD